MNIRNKYCRLSELTQGQIAKLKRLMPNSNYFDFNQNETLIGFSESGTAGTFREDAIDEIITYKEMLSLLGAKEEDKLVPHVHQKEIIAWANGEEIEINLGIGWLPAAMPQWASTCKFRVKPKLTPTQLRIQEVVAELEKLHEQEAVERGIDKVMEDLDCGC
jgi:hypothetical protein